MESDVWDGFGSIGVGLGSIGLRDDTEAEATFEATLASRDDAEDAELETVLLVLLILISEMLGGVSTNLVDD